MGENKDMVRVICCGNPLRGDDGIGLEVFRLLKKEHLPSHVEIFDGGILGINLLSLFQGCQKIILVDSVLMDKAPGHIQWFTMGDLLKTGNSRISNHEINPAQLMTLWHQLYGDSAVLNILLLGIVILDPIHLSDVICPEIKQSAVHAANEIKSKIRSLVAHEKC
ncbi:MAG: hydrogenase maturation protease [Desulfobacteraceae bacterium]|nr:hydrogenase maturation protease [Desulfobacteraceae bacterium]